jgi:MoaA/NifB/PqqE/SkfB family radical SAM enzyme
MPRETAGPWRITFDTNPDDCNMACIMCEEHSPHSTRQPERRAAHHPPRRMEIGLVRKILEESRGRGLREIIPSTMGEPLLYRDFDQIVDLCRQFGVLMNLTTNGTFPGRGAKAWAHELVPITSDVKISWNGATAATYEKIMLGGRFEQSVANVRAFVAVRDAHARAGGNRCRVTFQLTFLESNVDELADMVALAADLGVDRVKGHHLWAHFVQIKSLSMRRSSDAIARWNRAVDAATAVAQARGVLLENICSQGIDATADIDPEAVCPFLGQEAWIATDGRFNPCCAPDALRRGLGEFGNLRDTPLPVIWQSLEYRSLVAAYRGRELCRGCNMRKRVDKL